MALEIKSTPVLEGEEASRFIENATKKDFSAQVLFAQKILKKSL